MFPNARVFTFFHYEILATVNALVLEPAIIRSKILTLSQRVGIRKWFSNAGVNPFAVFSILAINLIFQLVTVKTLFVLESEGFAQNLALKIRIRVCLPEASAGFCVFLANIGVCTAILEGAKYAFLFEVAILESQSHALVVVAALHGVLFDLAERVLYKTQRIQATDW